MIHQRDLEQLTPKELDRELKRRKALEEAGLCIVCEEAMGCKNPCQHEECPLKAVGEQLLKHKQREKE